MAVSPTPVIYFSFDATKFVHTFASRFTFSGDLLDHTFKFWGSIASIDFHCFDDTNLPILHKVLTSIPRHITVLDITASGSKKSKHSCDFPAIIPDHITYLSLCFEKKNEHLFSHLLDNLPVALEVLSLSNFFPLSNPPPVLKMICLPSGFTADDCAGICRYYFDNIDSLQMVHFGPNFCYVSRFERASVIDLELSSVTITKKLFLSKIP